ncbi:hypothetical protein EIP86_004162 [Pleurotus ostreatoroseus]|nr:hypothetical protein EIP86_004162 [Pleurotus ostreatoroseus]
MDDAHGGLNSCEDGDGGGARTHRLALSAPPSLAVPQVSQGEDRRDRDRHRRRRRYPARRRPTRLASARRLLCGRRTHYQEVGVRYVDRPPLSHTTTTATATTLPPSCTLNTPPHTTANIMHINEAQPSLALLALDALRYGEARAQVAFVPSSEDEDVFKLKITVPRSIRVHGVPRKVFKLGLFVLGQLGDDFHLETMAVGDGVPTTTVRLTLCERQSPSALMLWEDARRAVEELPRLVDEPVRMNDFVRLDAHTGAMCLCMTGTEKHSKPEDAHGFPLFDAEGTRIVLSDARQFPLGVAMYAVFQLRCERDEHGMLSMRAIVSSLSLV